MVDGIYFPCLSTKAFEFLAYEKSDEGVKDGCIPVVTLTRYGKAESFQEAAGFLLSALDGRPAIVDFDPTPVEVTSAAEAERDRQRRSAARVQTGGKPIKGRSERQLASDQRDRDGKEAFNTHLEMLGDPVKGPTSWIGIIAGFPSLIPTVRLPSPEVVAEQIALARDLGCGCAVRVRLKEPADTSNFLRSLPLIESWPDGKSFLLVDAGYIRNKVPANAEAVKDFLSRTKAAMGDLFNRIEVVLLSNSFPKDSLKDYPEVIAMGEVELYRSVIRHWKISYGDYMSVAKRPKGSGSNGWYPHVDLVEAESWRIKLDMVKDDPQGFVRAATALIGEPAWQGRERCWGTTVIEAVREGKLKVDGTTFTVPGPWLSVRANQHLARMARR
ncbi:hypothetical protein HGP16_06365 [Rhizobium sp. P40RR-XXII]|uniref:beta family protein n=1 Tax=unclassified Rhizobium TaxID=2613769 RepID=UPI0014577D36|nr:MULTISPECIES: hypothetical protein [unclassified Rhizobium]NLR83760.1 hypothetical protein [Rhizobium sp. P28RR-XV]NLS16180.1 hypothetical protein [Rhizobium sp. P40RR-XXII]